MGFKLHLVIVAFIIVAVFIIWQLKEQPQAPVAVVQPAPQVESRYSIAITHASWGLNCRFRVSNRNSGTSNPVGAFVSDEETPRDKLREDNVLVAVSALCNGKLKCEFPLTPEALGGDPLPECKEKMIDIEYRCFSYDRPWVIRTSRGPVSINCDKGD